MTPVEMATEFAAHISLITLEQAKLTVFHGGNGVFAWVSYEVNRTSKSLIKFYASEAQVDCAQISVWDVDDFQHQLIKHIRFIKSLDTITPPASVNRLPYEGSFEH